MSKLLRQLKFDVELRDAQFEEILERMLARIPDNLDKRQGSIIYDALAPAAVELTEVLIEREVNRVLSYASMSTGEWLDLRVAEHGIYRKAATKAIRLGCFYLDEEKTKPFLLAPIGSKYSVPNEAVNFIVTKEIGNGQYELTCDEAGQIGNQSESGTALLPVIYLPELALVSIEEVIVPGEDAENDDDLYERFVQSITRPPFGGNRADYEQYFQAIDGVGPVKLFRADPIKGHVTAIMLGADWLPPSDELVKKAQTAIDPVVNAGQGIGQAPMAHLVHVQPAKELKMRISASLTLIRGWSIGQVQKEAEEAVKQYLLDLRKNWANYVSIGSCDYNETIVRIAQLEAAILQVNGIADISNTKIQNQNSNITLERDIVPVLGGISFTQG